jgi:outer membrane receptor protein involved in Fe transport
MSGVVNAVLRRGTDKFRWDAEVQAGGFVYSGGGRRRTDYSLESPLGEVVANDFSSQDPLGVQNYQASLSGPLGLPKTYFLVNGRRYVFNDYLEAERRFTPDIGNVPDSLSEFGIPPAVYKVVFPDGDGGREPLGYTREWSGVAKLTNRSIPNTELNYQAVVNDIDRRDTNWLFRLNPDGISRKGTFSISHGLDATHTLSKSTFLNATLRQNYFDYADMVHDNVWDAGYDSAGPGVGFSGYEFGAVVQGVEFNRFLQNTNSIVLKSTLTSQWRHDQQFKAGAEFEWPRLEFGTPGHLIYDAATGITRVENQPPHYPAVQVYWPYIAAGFAQSEGEWNDMNLRAGARLDYFNPMAGLPSDLSNPANAIEGAPESHYQVTTRKVSISPRLAISYPITRDAALFFAYGHFTQMPGLGQIYTNADYSALRDLQASSIQYEIMGNPDIKPEKTIQYQFGYRQAITDWLGVEANVYYKDVRDLLGVEFISTYNDAEYARWTNVDFGNVLGVTVVLDQRQRGIFSSALDYTWQRAFGNSSDPRETATRAEAGEDPRPRVIPFTWDQRHTLNLTLNAFRPGSFAATTVVRVASGQPYTPNRETGFDTSLETNSGRKPAGLVVDVRGEKPLRLGNFSCALFTRVFNLFDTRFLNGNVYDTSGSPYYSRFPEFDRISLADPTRFYPPRRIEVGVTLSSDRLVRSTSTP